MAKRPESSPAAKQKTLGSAKLIAALNQQVGHEMHASLQYVSIASHFEAENLPRLAEFFFRQAEEEREHAMKFVGFVTDIGGRLKIPAIGSPRSEFATAAEAVALSLDWEHTVTGQIYALVEIARDERNYIAQRFLDWFVNEQLEEINTMETLLSLVRRAGEDNLLLVEDYIAENKIGGSRRGGQTEAPAQT
jgi:ferritin